MYRLTNEETAELGVFLRTLCRMNRIDDAKHVAGMSDAQLSILIQSDKLWRTVDGEQDADKVGRTLADSLEQTFSQDKR